jgi:hypothetical protein
VAGRRVRPEPDSRTRSARHDRHGRVVRRGRRVPAACPDRSGTDWVAGSGWRWPVWPRRCPGRAERSRAAGCRRVAGPAGRSEVPPQVVRPGRRGCAPDPHHGAG